MTIKTIICLAAAITPGGIILGTNLYKARTAAHSSVEGLDMRSIYAHDAPLQPSVYQQMPLDPWGKNYRYEVVDGQPVIWSAGKDGVDHTADDIRITNP
jgi:hypothetical protein